MREVQLAGCQEAVSGVRMVGSILIQQVTAHYLPNEVFMHKAHSGCRQDRRLISGLLAESGIMTSPWATSTRRPPKPW